MVIYICLQRTLAGASHLLVCSTATSLRVCKSNPVFSAWHCLLSAVSLLQQLQVKAPIPRQYMCAAAGGRGRENTRRGSPGRRGILLSDLEADFYVRETRVNKGKASNISRERRARDFVKAAFVWCLCSRFMKHVFVFSILHLHFYVRCVSGLGAHVVKRDNKLLVFFSAVLYPFLLMKKRALKCL